MRCTQKLIGQIADDVRDGVPPKIAARRRGINVSTFERWEERGRRRARGDQVFIQLTTAIDEAEAEFETKLLERVHPTKDEAWRAAAWLLERRFPERYVRISVNSKIDEKAPRDAVAPTGDKVDELASKRARRRERVSR